MESGRDEAYKCKEIAEQKFRDRDLKESYRYAQKAYKLFSKLEGISAMITAVQVHLAAEAKLHSKLVDWYAILQVNEFSHFALIKKQYRKLSLVLRPDKNKSPVAEGAFKLIREAWAVLSNKFEKNKYDHMRRCLIIQQQQGSEPAPSDPKTRSSIPQLSSADTQMDLLKAQNVDFPNGLPSSADAPMDLLKGSSNAQSFMDTHNTSRRTPIVISSDEEDNATPANMASGKSKSVNSTFWTACSSCNTVQECPRYLECHELRCPDCMCSFLAVEVGTMSINDHNKRTRKGYIAGKISAGTMSINDYSKRTRNGNTEEKGSAIIEIDINSHEDNKEQDITREGVEDQPQKAKSSTKKVKTESRTRKGNVEENISAGTMSISDYNKRTRNGNTEEKVSAIIEIEINSDEDNKEQDIRRQAADDQPKKAKCRTKKVKNESKKQKNSVSSSAKEHPSVDPVLMAVQDSDFYDFDQDRVENCFEENQIWAMYDDHDGMPRYYALINKVVSLDPFKVQMTWLEGKDNGDECLIRWANAGFCRTCGQFREGSKNDTEFLNIFSHLMNGEKAVAGLLKIFPRRGSVWALYRNWQSDWDESTPKEVIRKYEIVGVMTDFTETMGGSVVPLVKLDGFKSVYRRIQMGSQAVRWVLRTEFLRFSHQIPARRLLGNEAQNLPKGCWELDPAATPIE